MRGCDCCGKGRMIPLPKAITPRPSDVNVGHYEKIGRIIEIVKSDREVEHVVENLCRKSKLQLDRDSYKCDDYFLPSSGFQRVFGDNVVDITDDQLHAFRIMYPAPVDGIKGEQQRKKKELESQRKRKEKQLSWSVDKNSTTDEVAQQATETLMRVMNELCNCGEDSCHLRTTGVKYDLVSRIVEHLRRMKLYVPKDIQLLSRDDLKMELKRLFYPTGGSLMDLQERLTRARLKLWTPSFDKDRQNTLRKSFVLTDKCARISSNVHAILCRQ